MIMGLISNVERDINPMLKELGLSSWLEVVVTSQESGFVKPQPEIFQQALKRAKVKASEAIYVGDQYQVDVIGAKNAGMKGILLDRDNYYKEKLDCPKIKSLSELASHVK